MKNKMKFLKEQFPLDGMVIFIILPIVSLIYIYISGIFKVNSLNDLFTYLNQNSILIVFCSFFILLSLYIWISFFKCLLEKPKKELLYLKLKIGDICKFIDIKGREYYFTDNNVISENYYNVLKTSKVICEILEVSKDTFDIIDKKEGYFENAYLFNKKIKGAWALIMVYVFFIVGVLTLVTNNGMSKLKGIPWALISLYIILYDAVCKYKSIKNQTFDGSGLVKGISFFSNIIKVTILLFITIFLFYMIFNSADNITRIGVSAFCLIFFLMLGNAVVKMFEK